MSRVLDQVLYGREGAKTYSAALVRLSARRARAYIAHDASHAVREDHSAVIWLQLPLAFAREGATKVDLLGSAGVCFSTARSVGCNQMLHDVLGHNSPYAFARGPTAELPTVACLTPFRAKPLD